MIGTQPTGAIEGVVIGAVSHDELTVAVDGKPARFAVVLADGSVVASGPRVAQELRAVVENCYRSFLRGRGWVRVFSEALSCAATTPAHARAVISAVSHEVPTVTVDGQRAQFAIVTEAGAIFAIGEAVAREAEAVAINFYRDYLMKLGRLRVMSNPQAPDSTTL